MESIFKFNLCNLLYHSYLNDYSSLAITLDLNVTKKIVNFYKKPNNIEIVNTHFMSAFILGDHKSFYLKTMTPITDNKFNYLGHAFSDKYLDNSLVLVRLLLYFPFEFLFVEDIIPSILKKYKNITFVIIRPAYDKQFLDKVVESPNLRHKTYKIPSFYTYECINLTRQAIQAEIFIISNDDDRGTDHNLSAVLG